MALAIGIRPHARPRLFVLVLVCDSFSYCGTGNNKVAIELDISSMARAMACGLRLWYHDFRCGALGRAMTVMWCAPLMGNHGSFLSCLALCGTIDGWQNRFQNLGYSMMT